MTCLYSFTGFIFHLLRNSIPAIFFKERLYCVLSSKSNQSNASALLTLFNIVFIFYLEIEIWTLRMSSCRMLSICHIADMLWSQESRRGQMKWLLCYGHIWQLAATPETDTADWELRWIKIRCLQPYTYIHTYIIMYSWCTCYSSAEFQTSQQRKKAAIAFFN